MKTPLQPQLIEDFLIESFEGLDQFDQDLLALEQGTADGETLHRVFRAIHSIKGTAGCLGLLRIEKVAHVGENLLSLLCEGRLKASSPIISTLLDSADALRGMLRNLEQSGTEGDADDSSLIARRDAVGAGSFRLTTFNSIRPGSFGGHRRDGTVHTCSSGRGRGLGILRRHPGGS